jgi:hypothetical protein
VLDTIRWIWDNTFGRMWDSVKKVGKGIATALETAKQAVLNAVQAIRDAIASVRQAISEVPVIGGFLAQGIPQFAAGGLVPGMGSGDTTAAMLTPGEFVLNRQMVAQVGVSNLESWRQGGQPAGGGITVENLNIMNPVAEPASDSLPRSLRKLAYVGAM